MAITPHELDNEAYQYHRQLLADLNLTVEWVYCGGELAIDQALVDRLWHTLAPTDANRARNIAYHISILGIYRDLWSSGDVGLPYGSDYQTVLPDTQTVWSELNLTNFTKQSDEKMHASLFDLLGRELPTIASEDVRRVAPAPNPPTEGTRFICIPVSQVWVAVREKGFKALHYPSAGLIINGEDQNYISDSTQSSVSGFVDRFSRTDLERTVKIITFIAGCHATRESPDPLAGMCGLLKFLNAQLVHHYHGKLGLSFLSDQYLCKLYAGDFMALLYLFKHLVFAIAWAGSHTTLQHVTIVIDGANHMEKQEHIEQWSNFVRILREIVFRIREIPDAASAYLARGLNFKYILIHPATWDLDPDKYETVISRTDVSETSLEDLAERDMGGSVWMGETRFGSVIQARAVADAGAASELGSASRSNGVRNGHR